MTVFIACALEDAPVANALETFLERRGFFVEAETGERGFRPMQRADVAVMLWSNRALVSLHRLQMERRALDAWAEGRLVLVQVDHGVLPVGLRDLRVIDATFEPQRDIAWAAVVKSIQDSLESARRLGPPEEGPSDGLDDYAHAEEVAGPAPTPGAPTPGAPTPGAPTPGPSAPVPQAPRRETAQGEATLWRWVFTGVIVLGAALGAASLLAGLSWALWATVAGMVALAGLAAMVAVAANEANEARNQRQLKRRSAGGAGPVAGQAQPESPPGDKPQGAVFVSYARADSAQVLPVVDAIKADGRTVWLDTEAIHAGEGWAGEIVRAIRTANRVLVMCSADAFQSDHVKREVYLADRYRRPLTPVYLEDAAPPEDFEYFFAAVQALRLHNEPEADRPRALAQALAAL